jgi:putative Mg2+ transporter-C (MgtC) family protein
MLAASIAMIQMNVLLATHGKSQNSYVVMDVMRLPLGILTGVGFIGAGAIVRKDELILGVTTAATLWFATVVGLCLGGGQIALGLMSAFLGYALLHWIRPLEKGLERGQLAELEVVVAGDAFDAGQLRQVLETARFQIKALSVSHSLADRTRVFDCEVRWLSNEGPGALPPVLHEIESTAGVVKLRWRAAGAGPQ